jgi:hypothetical protein
MAMLWRAFSSIAAEHPFWSQTIVATTKSIIADAGTQRFVEKRDLDTYDWKRTAVFGTFGFGESILVVKYSREETKLTGGLTATIYLAFRRSLSPSAYLPSLFSLSLPRYSAVRGVCERF